MKREDQLHHEPGAGDGAEAEPDTGSFGEPVRVLGGGELDRDGRQAGDGEEKHESEDKPLALVHPGRDGPDGRGVAVAERRQHQGDEGEAAGIPGDRRACRGLEPHRDDGEDGGGEKADANGAQQARARAKRTEVTLAGQD